MTEENSVPASDNADIQTAPEGDTSEKKQEHMIPKSRLDDANRKRREAEEALSHMAEQVIASVPEAFRDLIPDGSPAQRAAWVHKAHATGLFAKPQVPSTDSGKPKNTPINRNWTELSSVEKIGLGYKN